MTTLNKDIEFFAASPLPVEIMFEHKRMQANVQMFEQDLKIKKHKLQSHKTYCDLFFAGTPYDGNFESYYKTITHNTHKELKL